jgi:hypothetical protein
MKRLIRNKRTGKFFTRAGEWTEDVSVALNFISVRAAVEVESKLGLKDVELYLLQGEKPGGYDIVVPLGIPVTGQSEKFDSGRSGVRPF